MNFKDTKYLLAYTLAILLAFALVKTGIWYWAVPICAFGLIPILEYVLPQYKDNYSEKEEEQRKASVLFDLMLYVNLPLIYALLLAALYQIAFYDLNTLQTIGLVFSTGIIMSSNGINVAHEIGHRHSYINQLVSRLMLLPSLYMHFNIEHNLGHHKHVSTPQDPATAALGQSFYSFLPSSAIGGFISAWNIERKVLAKNKQLTWSFHNRMLHFIIIQLLYLALILIFLGSKALICAILIAMISSSLLEGINYVEHYGLERKRLKNGKYEPVQSHHSWNSDHTLGRIMLYELTRHSDHHFKSTRKFQVLRSHQTSPELPLGYPGSILLSLLPPLWFKIMNPLVAANQNLYNS